MGYGENGSVFGEARKFFLSSLRMLIAMVFLGYMMIWVMKPTNTFYTSWFPDIQAKTNSLFFGEEGANMLIYMFPVLLIAAVACLYVHLAEKQIADHTSQRVGSSRFALWKKPVLVRGPLGIVSWTELSFLAMFIGLLVWSFASYLHGMFAFTAREAAYEGLPVWEAKLQNAGLSLGLVGNICLAFLFFPVTRGSSILQLLGLTSESSIKYHIWLGHISMTLFTAHGLSYIIYWKKTHQISQMLKWDKFMVSNVAGEIALFSGLVMWVTSLKPIRRKIFELFFYAHQHYFLFVLFYVLHVGFSISCIVLAGFYIFLIDRFLRLLQSQQKIRLVSARVLPCQTVELNFAKSPELSYNPTSSLFINVANISKLQWHPFTITSNSKTDPDKLSIVIKSEGSWSSKLYQLLSSNSPLSHLEVSIEGPYGPSSSHFMRHDMLVMICGGSGITPFISIIREILFKSNTSDDIATSKLLLVCAFKKSEDLTMLDLILPVSRTNIDISRLQLQIEAYITRDKEFERDDHRLLRTIWFKPNAMDRDRAVCSVLGPKSWVWLGAIMSASFVTFLLIIGILTRYYIYPIYDNTGKVYSATAKSALGVLSVWASITVPASAAFLWNKRQNSKQTRQIQHTDLPTPATKSPTTVYQDIELESLPQQSLLQATKVHLGERPNIKKILMEREEASVGVLVSGPKSMREEAAQTCSSGFSNNLYFESFSFSW